MLARLRLSRFVIPLLIAAVFAGCAKSGSVSHLPPGAAGGPRGIRSFVPQNVCATTIAANPSTGSPAQIICYLQPNATTTVANLSMEPLPGGGTCGTAVWTVVDGQSPAPPGITVSVSPSTTGAPGTSCSRTDTVSMTVTTDSNLPNLFPDYYETYNIRGTFCRVINNNCEAGWTESAAHVTLAPALHIQDELLNSKVENTSVTSIAGQVWKLTLRSPTTADVSDCHWVLPSAFPNDAVDSYTFSASLSSPAPSTFNVNQNYLQFYWIKPETQMSIQANCSIDDGQSTRITANATYTIKEPTSSVTAAYGSIGADTSYHLIPPTTNQCTAVTGTYLHYGDPCVTNGTAIKSVYTTTADADEAGRVVLWQLINSLRTVTSTGGTTTVTKTTSGQSCVDNAVEYAPNIALSASSSAVVTSDDSPGLGALDGYAAAHAADAFDDYFMYKPNDNALGSSIWIALDRLQWSWDAQTSASGGVWATPTINAQLAPANGTAYTDLPRWGCQFVNNSGWRRMAR
jgi:hypothetical protein